jgi:hypothetical protein
MSTRIPHYPRLNLPHRLVILGLMGWVFASCVILAFLAATSLDDPGIPQLIDVFSEIRVTPSWPQMGVFPFVGNP